MNKPIKQNSPQYSQVKSTKWLSWIARNMQKHDQTVFFIEGIQVSWLPRRFERIVHLVSFVITLGLLGLILGLISELLPEIKDSMDNALIPSCLGFGLIFGIIFSIGKNKSRINTIELTFWSWEKLKKDYKEAALIGLVSSTALTIGFGLIIEITPNRKYPWDSIITLAMYIGMAATLISVFISGWDKTLPKTTTKPNEGINITSKNSIKWMVLGAVIGLISGIYIAFIYMHLYKSNPIETTAKLLWIIFEFMIMYGIVGGMIGGVWFGGKDVIRHYMLRFLIYIGGYGPWNYVDFLDYAVDKLHFMRRVGGSYIFLHRMLLEHFANIQENDDSL